MPFPVRQSGFLSNRQFFRTDPYEEMILTPHFAESSVFCIRKIFRNPKKRTHHPVWLFACGIGLGCGEDASGHSATGKGRKQTKSATINDGPLFIRAARNKSICPGRRNWLRPDSWRDDVMDRNVRWNVSRIDAFDGTMRKHADNNEGTRPPRHLGREGLSPIKAFQRRV